MGRLALDEDRASREGRFERNSRGRKAGLRRVNNQGAGAAIRTEL